MKNPNYLIKIDGLSLGTQIPSDMALSKQKESGQQFFTTSLTQPFKLIGKDARYVIESQFEHKFSLEIIKIENGVSSVYYKGLFFKSSCTIDELNNVVEATVTTDDDYRLVLANLDTEVDLVKIGTPTTPVILKSRPILQIYVKGSTKLTNIIDDLSWEQDVTSELDETIIRTRWGFSKNAEIGEAYVKGNNPLVEGMYSGDVSSGSMYDFLTSTNQQYKITQRDVRPNPNVNTTRTRIVIINTTTNAIVYVATKDFTITDFAPLKNFSRDVELVPYNATTNSPNYTSSDKQIVTLYSYIVFARVLASRKNISGSVGMAVSTDDIIDQNLNYRYVFSYRSAQIYHSTNTSMIVTKYGKNTIGSYYAPPSINGVGFMPIDMTEWHKGSLWFAPNVNDYEFEREGRHSFTVNNAYKLTDVIQSLLKSFKSGVLFSESDSKFLYNAQNVLGLEGDTLLLIPKSNVLHGETAKPAMKAPIKLNQIFEMLATCFKVYWDIEAGRLRIEHLDFYDRGGTYTGNKQIGVDLTVLNSCNKMSASAKANTKYSYEDLTMPSKIQFSWMDEASTLFKGSDILITSVYVVKDSTDTKSSAVFSSDVDYLIANPSSVSQDGFVVVRTEQEELVEFVNQRAGYIEDGTGVFIANLAWRTIDLPCCSGTVYTIRNAQGQVTNDVTVTAFNDKKEVLTRLLPFRGVITTQSKAEYLSISWKVQDSPIEPTIAISNVSSVKSDNLATYIAQLQYQSKTYTSQNIKMCYPYLHYAFNRYGSPAKSMNVNGIAYQALSVLKHKKNDVEFTQEGELDTNKLIKTLVGTGAFQKVSVNLLNRKINASVLYDD